MKPIILRQHEVIHLRDTGSVIAWRVVKPQPVPFAVDGPPDKNSKALLGLPWMPIGGVYQRNWPCPYGRTREGRWVKESGYWILENVQPCVAYRADGERKPPGCSWMPSCTMPRWASRFTVTLDVGVKRIHEVTEEEAIDSGVMKLRCHEFDKKHFPIWRGAFDDCVRDGLKPPVGPSPRMTFRALTESKNDQHWDRNDYFWKITCAIKK